MVGDLRQVAGEPRAGGLQGLRRGEVEPRPSGAAQPVEQCLADQGVDEAVPPERLGRLVDEAGVAGHIDDVKDLVVATRDRLEHVDVELVAEHGRGRQDLHGVAGEARQPPIDDFANAGRHAGGLVGALDEVGRELLDEERVAGRGPVQLAHPLRGERTSGLPSQLGGGVDVEAPHREALDEVVAAKVGDGIGEVPRVAGVDVARRAEDEQRARFGVAQHVEQEGRRRRVGPVEVVDDEEHRADLGLRVHEGGDRLEQPEALGGGVHRPFLGNAHQLGEEEPQPFVGAEDHAASRRAGGR